MDFHSCHQSNTSLTLLGVCAEVSLVNSTGMEYHRGFKPGFGVGLGLGTINLTCEKPIPSRHTHPLLLYPWLIYSNFFKNQIKSCHY